MPEEGGTSVEEQLQWLRERLDELLQREEAAAQTRLEVPPPLPATPRDLAATFVSEEIPAILAAAEQSAARIVEGARRAAEQQIAQARRLWEEAQTEVARLQSWREHVEPLVRSVQAEIHDIRARFDEVPGRIQQALAPVVETVASIDGKLEQLGGVAMPPAVTTPWSLGLDRDEWGDAAPQDGGPD